MGTNLCVKRTTDIKDEHNQEMEMEIDSNKISCSDCCVTVDVEDDEKHKKHKCDHCRKLKKKMDSSKHT